MIVCKVCSKELDKGRGKKKPRVSTGLCITCFNLSKIGSKNHNWKGDNVGYPALHQWARKQIVRPEVCPVCNIRFPIDLANISQEYKRDLSDWEWLCRKCHMDKDGRSRQTTNERLNRVRLSEKLDNEVVKHREYRKVQNDMPILPSHD